MNVNQEVRLNLSADGIPPRLFMPQGDANSRTIIATLWDGATPYNVPTSAAVMVRFRKPDGTGGLYDATEAGTAVTASGNTVTAPVATQMLAVAGVVQAEIDIYGTGSGKAADRLATFRFAVEVAPSVYPDAQIISSDYFNLIAATISEAIEAAAKAELAKTASQAAQSAAETAQSGAESAEQGAQAAQAAAENAKTAAQTAQHGAKAAQDTAEDAQAAAASSAAAAAASAANAATSVEGAVKYNTPQTLTDAQKQQARDNINAPAPYEAGDNISITGGIITTKAFPCNPNLLDNWYFGNPVNQRGQTSYTGAGYGIDRWKRTSSDGITTLNEGYMSLVGNGANLAQILEGDIYKYLRGKEVTLSILARGNVAIISEDFINSFSAAYLQSETFTVVSKTITVRSDANRFIYNVQPQDGDPNDIVAVKLELGSQQTLAHQENGAWVLNEIPDYGEQLRRCQRYYFAPAHLNGLVAGGKCVINYPVIMRATPVFSIKPDIGIGVRKADGSIAYKNADTLIRVSIDNRNCVMDTGITDANGDVFGAENAISFSADL